MSVRAMTWAIGQRVGSPMAKLALLALTDHHNNETGTDPFPTIKTIAAETELNERSVRRHLEALKVAGLIACLMIGSQTRPSSTSSRRRAWTMDWIAARVRETS